MANSLRYQLRALHETTVIESLGDRQFLPRYGFPIGLHQLKVIVPTRRDSGRWRVEDQFRLERPGLLALGEYVPGSQLIVGGKVVTSRGILKHWTGANIDSALGLRGKYLTCPSGHLHYSISQDLGDCPLCGSAVVQPPRDLLFARNGYSTAAWDPPRASTEIDQVGEVQRATVTFTQDRRDGAGFAESGSFAGVAGLSATYREDGELLVYNEGDSHLGFAICLRCGYAESETQSGSGQVNLPRNGRFAQHAPLESTNRLARCWVAPGDAQVLRHQSLAARESTDVLLFDFTTCLGQAVLDGQLMNTVAAALSLAGSQLLELDARELGAMLTATDAGGGQGVVIYDNVPGGAGHVRELFDLGRCWLEAAVADVLWINAEHHAHCESGCLDCVLSFNRHLAAAEPYRWRQAHDLLRMLLDDAGPPGAGTDSVASPDDAGDQPPRTEGIRGAGVGSISTPKDEGGERLSDEERLARARVKAAGKRKKRD
jgi:hypothetical protein